MKNKVVTILTILVIVLTSLIIINIQKRNVGYEDKKVADTISNSEILFEHEITDKKDTSVFTTPNHDGYTRKGIYTAIMDGEKDRLKYYYMFMNSYKSIDSINGGLEDGEDLTITIDFTKNGGILDISKYQDIRLNLDSFSAIIYGSPVSYDSLIVYVYDENNNKYGPYYIDDYEIKGLYYSEDRTRAARGIKSDVADEDIDPNKKIYFKEYNIVTENLKKSNLNKISKIEIQPYGTLPQRCDTIWKFSNWFCSHGKSYSLAGVSIEGYINSSYKKLNDGIEKNINIDETREKIVQRIYDVATIKWQPTVDFYVSKRISSVDLLKSSNKYSAGKIYYGTPYTQLNRVPVEKFYSELDGNKKLKLLPGLDISDFDDNMSEDELKERLKNLSVSEDTISELDTIDKLKAKYFNKLLEQNYGNDCTTAVSYSFTKFIHNPLLYTISSYIWNKNLVTVLGNLKVNDDDTHKYMSSSCEIIAKNRNGNYEYKDSICSYNNSAGDENGQGEVTESENVSDYQNLYKGYAELMPGDVTVTFSNSNSAHIRMVTGNTHVVCNDNTILQVSENKIGKVEGSCDSHGGIDPDKSYVFVSGIASYTEPFKYDKNVDANSPTCVDNKNNKYGMCAGEHDYVVPFNLKEEYTDFDINKLKNGEYNNDNYGGIGFQINSKIYFTALKNTNYLPARINALIEGKIEEPYAKIINSNTNINLKYGLKGTIYSNYTINYVKIDVDNATKSKEFKIYPNHRDQPSGLENLDSSIYSLYYNTPIETKNEINEMLKEDNSHIKITVSAGEEDNIEVLNLVTEPHEWYEDYDYTIEENNIILTKYKGNDTKITIPKEVEINNKKYQTVINGGVFKDNKVITSVEFANGVKAGNSLRELFMDCTNLETVVFNDFDTSNVTTMYGMFTRCGKLKELDVSSFNTSNVINFQGMFHTLNITSLDLSNFDTRKATNMSYMFYNSTKLKTIIVGEQWNTDSVTNSGSMFSNCSSLVGVKGTKYDKDKVDKTYARIDGINGNKGYLTSNVIIIEEIKVKDSSTKINNNQISITIPYNYTLKYEKLKEKLDIPSSAIIKNVNDKVVESNDEILGTGSKIILNNNTYDIIVKGDISKDGKISSLDYVAIRRHIMNEKIISKSTIEYLAADMNNDNNIKSMDYVLLRKIIMAE